MGYLLKDRVDDLDDFADAVRRIARGGSVIDPEVVAQLVGRRRARVPLDDLTEREREVLALMAEGRSNQAICDRLFLAPEDGRGPHREHLLEARAAAGARRPPPRPRGPRPPARLTAAPRGAGSAPIAVAGPPRPPFAGPLGSHSEGCRQCSAQVEPMTAGRRDRQKEPKT